MIGVSRKVRSASVIVGNKYYVHDIPTYVWFLIAPGLLLSIWMLIFDDDNDL